MSEVWGAAACGFLVPFGVSLAGTALLIRVAPRLGLVDHPNERKVHTTPTPKGGGLAVFVAVVLAAWLPVCGGRLAFGNGELLFAASAVVLVGLIDDLRPLPWQLRLGVQAGVALLLCRFRPEWSTLVVVVWVVGLVNAFNMLDNMDALSGGVAWIAAAFFAAAVLVRPWPEVPGTFEPAVPFVTLTGALSGFLWFNRPPARIFLGDAGSTFLGFFLGTGALAVGGLPWEESREPPWSWGVPLCVLAVPLYDMTSVVLIRLSQGRSPFHADKQHLSHRLVGRGLSKPAAVAVIHLLALASGAGGLVLYWVSTWQGAALVGALVACGWGAVAALELIVPSSGERLYSRSPPTSRRTKDKPAAETSAAAPLEWLRRALLGLVVALVVARPVVVGEDPGLVVDPSSDPAPMVLTLLWLVAAVGWAVWRALARQTTVYAGAVTAALAAAVVLVFASAARAAAYKHPAWLIAWEWAGLLAAFFLVRQLATRAADLRGVLAAVLATGVMLSAYAVYQGWVEIPRQLAEFHTDPGKLVQQFQERGLALDKESIENRLRMDHVYSTFAHPNSFAGYLALLLPAAAAAALSAWRGRLRPWQTALTAGCALLVAYALWLTHSRGAILATLLVGVATLAAVRLSRRGLLLAGAGLAAVALAALFAFQAGWGASGFGKGGGVVGQRLDYWRATWAMINDHPWLGVGPGNFGRHYPRYMLPTAYEEIKDPHNFALEMWATGGLFALAALLAALGAFFWKVLRRAPADDGPPEASPLARVEPRWEFYLGGMAGLLLSFVLRVWGAANSDFIIVEAAASAVRSLAWFAAFALLDAVPWSGRTVRIALAAGVAALLLNLGVSGGIAFPSVAQPMWVMAALALNAAGPAGGRRLDSPLALGLPVPALAAVLLLYFFIFFYPVTAADGLARRAGAAARFYFAEQDRLQDDAAARRTRRRLPPGFLTEQVLDPLDRAVKLDRYNARLHTELLELYGRMWAQDTREDYALRIVHHANAAQKLDREGKDGYWAEFQVRQQVVRRLQADREKFVGRLGEERYERTVREQHELAAQAAARLAQLDPGQAKWRYWLAKSLDEAGRPDERDAAARRALDLHDTAPAPQRGLTDAQGDEVRKWLAPR